MSASKELVVLPVVLDRLHATYPNARYELDWKNPLQLLVATILAAQCTDERVNAVTCDLFRKYPDAGAYARADPEVLGEDIRPTGYFREKARAIKDACQVLVDSYGGQVPRDMDDMLILPRVARKTANVVLTQAYGIPSGVVVDTHVARVAQRLGIVEEEKPEKIEDELMGLLPQSEWVFFGPAVILHGRYTCTAADPKCPACVFEDVCQKRGLNGEEETGGRKKSGRSRRSSHAETSETFAGDEPAAFDEIEEDERAPRSRPLRRSSRTGGARARTSSHGESSMRLDDIPDSWRTVLAPEFDKPYFKALKEFVDEERANHQVFPPEEDVFNALKYTPFDEVKVLLLGQDPYHDDGQAHGLCFSVRPGVKSPPSLVNMFKELKEDLGCSIPNNGYLVPWAKQGVLLLNAVLTVRAHEPNSHKDKGWEQFTDAIIRATSDRSDPVVYVLWGSYAQKKEKFIDTDRHVILKAAHPSPLSAKKFFGSRPFSAVNEALARMGKEPIDWQIPNL
jgi:uracil-DNA glycosylase